MDFDLKKSKSICRRNERGSAMIEMVVCMLPYLIVLMGAMMVSSMTMGKQEVIKYSTSEVRPGGESLDQAKFFSSLKGQKLFSPTTDFTPSNEFAFNSQTRIEDADEPVLPYKENGDDIARAIDLSGTRVHYSAQRGGFVVSRGQSGSRLQNLGFLEDASGEVYQEGDDIEQNIMRMDLVQDVSAALGDWLIYRGASADFGYTLPFQGAVPMESAESANSDWRSSMLHVNENFARRYYWPVVDNPEANRWSSYADASSMLSSFYSMEPDGIGTKKFSTLNGYNLDIGTFSTSGAAGGGSE